MFSKCSLLPLVLKSHQWTDMIRDLCPNDKAANCRPPIGAGKTSPHFCPQNYPSFAPTLKFWQKNKNFMICGVVTNMMSRQNAYRRGK